MGTGNILADFLLRDMTFGFSEFSAGRNADQRWKDFELYVADSWQPSKQLTVDYGVRYSLLLNPYANDDRVMNFVPSLFNPALGNDTCNGLLQPPGSNWCQDAGALGGDGCVEPFAHGSGLQQLRAATRRRLGRVRRRQDGGARRPRPVLPARAIERRC